MRYIDMTPSWIETAHMLITILENSDDPSALAFARDEILRMGEIIDTYMAHDKAEENVDG
jgi:hypothetical protein